MRTILVIDDEQPMLRLIRSALKGLGFEVLTSESGTEGLEIIRNVRPALVISDLHMGEMDGLSVLAATREQPETRAIPFIFMTGDASTASYRRGMEMGADDFLIKPFDADQLRRSVESRFTRLKGVSAEIEQARDRLFSMMDAMPNLVAVAEGDALALTYLNPYGRDLLELSADEKLAGLHLFDFLPGWALAKALHEAMPDTLRDGSWTGEMALTGRRGCEHHVSMQWVQNGTNPDGEPCIGLIARDITEQRRQKAGLERGEELFRVIAENAADIIALLDPAGQSLFDSSAGKPVLGYDQSQLHARWLWEAVHKEDADKMICAFQDAVNAGIEQRIECRLRHQDGSWRVFEFYYGVLRNEEKVVERVLMTARDITQRKAAEERLRNSEALYQSLVDNLPQNIFRKDREGRFTFANERFGRLLHRTPAEIVGCCDQDFYPPELADKFRADDQRVMQSGTSIQLQEEHATPDGRRLFTEVIKIPLRDKDDNVVGIQGIFWDITEQRLAEENRSKMELQLRQSQKLESIGQLAAGIAHEINSPTQFIGDNIQFQRDGFNDLLELINQYRELQARSKTGGDTGALVAEIEKTVGRIDLDYLLEEIPKAISQSQEGVERVATIVRAMKEFSHPGSRERTSLDLNRAIESTIIVARNEWKYVAELETDLDPQLPLVPCLPGEFNQVVLNLIVNASHAIADVVGDGTKGKGTIRISTRRAENDWVEIRIADTGSGIPADICNRIFDPFFTTKGVGKGTGQGLAIARSVVVDKHQGTLTFETARGKGTTFIIRLPLVEPKSREEAA